MTREKFTLHDEFVAALYDRRLHNGALPRGIKDVWKGGHIIERLYKESASGNNNARNALIELRELIGRKYDHLIDAADVVHGMVNDRNNELFKEPEISDFVIPYRWPLKMYLAIIDMLLILDKASISLSKLRINNAIEQEKYGVLQKQLANPVRAVLEEIFRVEKRHGV